MIPPKVFCFFNNKTSPMVYFCQKYNRYQRELNYKCEKNLLSPNKIKQKKTYIQYLIVLFIYCAFQGEQSYVKMGVEGHSLPGTGI